MADGALLVLERKQTTVRRIVRDQVRTLMHPRIIIIIIVTLVSLLVRSCHATASPGWAGLDPESQLVE
jgi:hypothetical protein